MIILFFTFKCISHYPRCFMAGVLALSGQGYICVIVHYTLVLEKKYTPTSIIFFNNSKKKLLNLTKLFGKMNKIRLNQNKTKKYRYILTCTICDKEFYCRSQLKQHEITHTGYKPHKCSVCSKSFNRVSNLNAHTKTHNLTGALVLKRGPKTSIGKKRRLEPRNICSVCDRSFKAPSALSQHKLTHTSEKPFPCAFCDRTFNKKGNSKYHMQRRHSKFITPTESIHSPSDTHCPICKKQFYNSDNLISHQKLYSHFNPSPISVTRQHLPKHSRGIDNEQPPESIVSCQVCEELSCYTDLLEAHKKEVHHGDVSDQLDVFCDFAANKTI